MNKNQLTLELERVRHRTIRFEAFCRLASVLIKYGSFVVCVFIIFYGLKSLVDGRSAQVLLAMSQLVKSFGLQTWLGYVWGGVSTSAWLIERKGKKRAIKEKSEYQHRAEGGEVNRTSSGLTPTGETPELGEQDA